MKLTGSMRLLAVAGCLTLAACGMKHDAEEAVRKGLKDPDSAKFGELYYNDKTEKGCLEVNAKNSMGGYTGTQQAYVKHTKNGWEEDGIADISLKQCREIFADAAD